VLGLSLSGCQPASHQARPVPVAQPPVSAALANPASSNTSTAAPKTASDSDSESNQESGQERTQAELLPGLPAWVPEPVHSGNTDTPAAAGSAGSSGSSVSMPASAAFMAPAPVSATASWQLTDVQLAHGASIVSDDGPAAIQSDYTGLELELVLLGSFGTSPFSPQDVSVILDNGIVLQVLSVQTDTIRARLNTQGIPDLYLVGNDHLLQLQLPQATFRKRVRVGPPERPMALTPVIQAAELIRDDHGQPVQMRLRGQHLMFNKHFAQVRVNQQVMPILFTQFENNQSVSTVSLSGPEFQPASVYEVVLSTPFGVSYASISE